MLRKKDSALGLTTACQREELFITIAEKHAIPHKFAYLNAGANAWDTVSRDPEYDLGQRELSALKKFMQRVSQSLKSESFNVLHTGPGNGREIPTVIETLGVQRIARYALIDISPELLRITKSYGNELYKTLKFISFIHDVTKPGISKIAKRIRRNGADRNLILLIANGGILSDLSCLTYIRDSMMLEDRLLITLELYSANQEEQILEQYKLPSIIRLFAKSLSLIGINEPAPEQFKLVYNKKKALVEVYFFVKQWLESHAGEKITFGIPLPEKIKVFSSLRPTPSVLKRFLTSKGFNIEVFHYFKKERCCGIVCSV